MADTSSAGKDALNEFMEQRWWAMGLRGLIAVLFGILCFANPALAAATLVLWFGIFSIMDGVFALFASAGQARRGERWAWLAVEAVASIVIGVIVLVMPGISLLVLYLVIAIKAAITGILLLVASAKLDGEHGQGWLVLSGVASLLFAVLLFAAPMLGAKILIWWIGTWAIVFGVALIALAFKLKSIRKSLRRS